MFKFIAGPCVIESEELVLKVAEEIKKITDDLGIDFYFKSIISKINYCLPGIYILKSVWVNQETPAEILLEQVDQLLL